MATRNEEDGEVTSRRCRPARYLSNARSEPFTCRAVGPPSRVPFRREAVMRRAGHSAFMAGALVAMTLGAAPRVVADPERDAFGYNYRARMFNGLADGADRVLDGAYFGDPSYASDRLLMKWSKAWDDAHDGVAPWSPDAWTANEWNGKVPGGSGSVWHYKIVWVGPELEKSRYWHDGGYAIWGEFEVIMSHGTVANQHMWDALARSPGFGGPHY